MTRNAQFTATITTTPATGDHVDYLAALIRERRQPRAAVLRTVVEEYLAHGDPNGATRFDQSIGSFNVTPELKAAVDEFAAENNIFTTDVVRRAIERAYSVLWTEDRRLANDPPD